LAPLQPAVTKNASKIRFISNLLSTRY
jgi:hypothetical protein